MNNKKAIAHFRQLCALGLPQEGLAPALLETLHKVVPSLHNRMCWCDERQNMTAFFCEHPDMYFYGKLFLEHYDNRLPDFPGSRFIMSRRPGVGHYLPIVTNPKYFAGTYHNEVERPAGGHYFLDVVIGDERGTLGAILLTREPGARPYSARELLALEQLIPYMAHAMRAEPVDMNSAMGRSDSALLITDFDGRVRHATAKARQWLSMAFYPEARRGEISSRFAAELPPRIAALCRAVVETAQGRTAPPPKLTIQNAWGNFYFSAQLLRGQRGGETDQIAVILHYAEPRAVTLMRNMWQLGLSTAQKQVCLLLMEQHATEAQIAQQLGISATTVRDHLNKIYGKLNLHTREDLVKRLMDTSEVALLN